MNKKNYFFMAFFVGIFSTSALASEWSTGKILQIRIQPSAQRVLIIQENQTNPHNCSKTDYLTLPIADDVFHRELFSALLTTHLSKQTVLLRLQSCTTAGRAEVSEVWLK